MKKFSYIILTSLVLAMTVACSQKQKNREDQIAEFRSEITEEDSVAVLKLSDNAMEMLKGKKIDDMIASLYEYNDSTGEVKKITDATAKRYKRMFSMFPVIEYEREYVSFMLEGCNDVKYKVTFATAEQTSTGSPATTMFMFNPIRDNGEWKLCVKTPHDQVDQELN